MPSKILSYETQNINDCLVFCVDNLLNEQLQQATITLSNLLAFCMLHIVCENKTPGQLAAAFSARNRLVLTVLDNR